MNHKIAPNIIELPELRDRVRVFQDRPHAGEVLAKMLSSFNKGDAIVLAIPAGGVPVAIAGGLYIPLFHTATKIFLWDLTKNRARIIIVLIRNHSE